MGVPGRQRARANGEMVAKSQMSLAAAVLSTYFNSKSESCERYIKIRLMTEA